MCTHKVWLFSGKQGFFVQEYNWKHTFPLVHHRALPGEGLQTVGAVDNICTAAELWTVQAVHLRLMFVGGSLLHLWLQNTVVLPGKACVYPLFTQFLLFFSQFFPLFLFLSQVQRNIAPCRLTVLCWFVQSHISMCFLFQTKDGKKNLKLRPCRF